MGALRTKSGNPKPSVKPMAWLRRPLHVFSVLQKYISQNSNSRSHNANFYLKIQCFNVLDLLTDQESWLVALIAVCVKSMKSPQESHPLENSNNVFCQVTALSLVNKLFESVAKEEGSCMHFRHANWVLQEIVPIDTLFLRIQDALKLCVPKDIVSELPDHS